jgi:hypothetical protein
VSTTFRLTCALLVLAPVLGTTAHAQSGGLFGQGRSNGSERQSLSVNFTLAEGYDTELPDEFGSQVRGAGRRAGGLTTTLLGAGTYTRNTSRVRFATTGQTTFRYFDRLERLDLSSATVGLGVDSQLPARAALRLDQRVAYRPSYLYQLLPTTTPPTLGQPIDPAPDYQVVQSDSYMSQSTVSLTKRVGRASQMSASAGYDRTDFQGALAERARGPKLDSYQGQAAFSHSLRRNLRFSLGYAYRTGDFGFGVSHQHQLAVAAEYSKALSRSRRALFQVSLAPSTLDLPSSALDRSTPGVAAEQRLYRLQGGLSVSYPFHYNWTAAATVRRSIQYLAVLAEPVLSDAARLNLSGHLSRRLNVSASAGYAKNASATRGASRVSVRTGTLGMRVALSSHIALFSEYLFYAYDLAQNELVTSDLPPLVNQHGVRIGATLWAAPF